jgi:hypothetical protein
MSAPLASHNNHENLSFIDKSLDKEVIYKFNQFKEKYAK